MLANYKASLAVNQVLLYPGHQRRTVCLVQSERSLKGFTGNSISLSEGFQDITDITFQINIQTKKPSLQDIRIMAKQGKRGQQVVVCRIIQFKCQFGVVKIRQCLQQQINLFSAASQ